MTHLPNKKYDIIYCDPPWSYKDKASAGKRGASYKYKLMTMNDLFDLQVESICNDNCICFMWCTYPQLQNGLNLMRDWGFIYKTVAFTWVKKYKNGDNFMGMGNWTRSNAEIVLLGIKGKPKRINAGIRQIIESIPEKHSKKPNEARNKIIDLCGDLSRIELFAREKTKGWDVWGNEV